MWLQGMPRKLTESVTEDALCQNETSEAYFPILESLSYLVRAEPGKGTAYWRDIRQMWKGPVSFYSVPEHLLPVIALQMVHFVK